MKSNNKAKEQLDVTSVTIYAFNGSNAAEKQDFLATEEPLEIRIEYGPDHQRVIKSLSVTMRTPGADADLVRGFLLTEGIIRYPVELQGVRVMDALPGSQEAGNIVLAQLDPAATFDMQRLDRHFYTTSSCGVCGKTSIDAVKMASNCSIVKAPSRTLDPDIIYTLSDTLRAAQDTFTLTGGLHAAALFDFSGRLLAVREDVGRHNALDKIIGYCTWNNTIPMHDSILLLSGRASFELLQKAAMAGIAVVCAVGAPSSLAVATADAFGITLIGFLREKRFNLYTRHAGL